MARDTDANDVSLAALDHLMVIQKEHGALLAYHGDILTRLEQRPIPDIAGLARRVDDIADAVDRLKAPEPVQHRWWHRPMSVRRWWHVVCIVLLAMVTGWSLGWFTVRWLPGSMLPPGFSRVEPVKQKGRY